MDLECEFPAYTGRPANTMKASGLMQLPAGTKVTIRCEANKDLVAVPVTMVKQEQATPLERNLAAGRRRSAAFFAAIARVDGRHHATV